MAILKNELSERDCVCLFGLGSTIILKFESRRGPMSKHFLI